MRNPPEAESAAPAQSPEPEPELQPSKGEGAPTAAAGKSTLVMKMTVATENGQGKKLPVPLADCENTLAFRRATDMAGCPPTAGADKSVAFVLAMQELEGLASVAIDNVEARPSA